MIANAMAGRRRWRVSAGLLRKEVRYPPRAVNDNESDKDVPPHNGRTLEPVGLSAQEERTYLLLLDRPGLNRSELAQLLDQSEQLTDISLSLLEAKGLVARSSGGRGYRPAPPDVVIKALVERKHEDLRRTEASVERLLQRVREATARRTPREEFLEVVAGEEALSARLDQLQRTVQRDALGFITAACPYRAPQSTFERARARGVQIRMVYDREALERADMLDTARRQIAIGGQVRVAESVPATLAIFDRDVALIPEHDGVQGALLVGTSAVLDVLVEFFESMWDRASPLPVANGDAETGQVVPDYDDLITLLASGYKDDSIARRLGLSTRTMDRRVHSLMKALDAATRFQAGWVAAHRSRQVDR